MMKKVLLLMSLLINLFIFATLPKSLNNIALQLVINLNKPASSKIMTTHFTSYRTNDDPPEAFQAPKQPADQISEGTPTPTFTQPADKKNSAPTRTPRPTTTPMPIPPPANPNATSLMILFGLIAVIIVIVGVWSNRPEK
jgi:hypothetical protein